MNIEPSTSSTTLNTNYQNAAQPADDDAADQFAQIQAAAEEQAFVVLGGLLIGMYMQFI